MTNICAEGADVEPPIHVVLVGSSFAATADEALRASGSAKMGNNISMTGPNSLARLAEHLLALGLDPDRELSLYRAGTLVGTTTISQAAKAFI
jgi:hypothetical protein